MKIQGKMIKVLDLQSGIAAKTGKEWQKQSIVLDTGADFNNEICIDLFGDKIELIQNIKIGTFLECLLNVSSKEYNGRYYTNVSAWDVNIIDSPEEATEPVKSKSSYTPDEGCLPF